MSERKMRSKSIGHYVLLKTIGEGTFGKVKLGTHILTGERVAIKVLEKERIVEVADVERVAREIHILKLIRQCRHIIQLYEIIETPRQLYLIMEYAPGGELFDYIVQHGRAEEPEACRFLHQILAGVERVHSMRVVHRDLKPENLLLDDRRHVKIVDFGLSNTHKEGQLLQTACGSPCYAAPEMIAGHKYHPPLVDVWSCGVILFALVCGYLPFEAQDNHNDLYQKILNAEYEKPDFLSPEVSNLISGILCTDPAERMTIDDIRQHAWYRQIPEASLPDREDAGELDEDILQQLVIYGFSREYAVKTLCNNKHNHATTSYHLIKEKLLRSVGQAEQDTTSAALADLEAAFDGGAEAGQRWPPLPPSPTEAQAAGALARGSVRSRSATPGGVHCAGAGDSPRPPPPGSGGWCLADAADWCDEPAAPLTARTRLQGAGLVAAGWAGQRALSSRGAAGRDGVMLLGPGTFQVSCGSGLPPQGIVHEVVRALKARGLRCRQPSAFVVRCAAGGGLHLLAEVGQEDVGGGFALRLSRVSGDPRLYKDTCARLLADLHL